MKTIEQTDIFSSIQSFQGEDPFNWTVLYLPLAIINYMIVSDQILLLIHLFELTERNNSDIA